MTIDLRNSTDYEVLRAAKVLARLAEVAREVQIDFLLVGATARTIISIGLLGTPPGVSVRVPSIPALALLKLFAWQDRHYDDTRDAVDLVAIIKWYSSERYLDRLYTEWLDVLERFDYDPPLAGAWLLGGHMSDLLDDQAVAVLLDVIENGDLMGRLARDMAALRASELVTAMGDGIRDAVAGRPRSGRR